MNAYLLMSTSPGLDGRPEVKVEGVYSSQKEAVKHKEAFEAECQLWTVAPTYHIEKHVVERNTPSTPRYNNVRVLVRRSMWENGLAKPIVIGSNEKLQDLRKDRYGFWHGVLKNDPGMSKEEFNEFVLKQCKEEK